MLLGLRITNELMRGHGAVVVAERLGAAVARTVHVLAMARMESVRGADALSLLTIYSEFLGAGVHFVVFNPSSDDFASALPSPVCVPRAYAPEAALKLPVAFLLSALRPFAVLLVLIVKAGNAARAENIGRTILR